MVRATVAHSTQPSRTPSSPGFIFIASKTGRALLVVPEADPENNNDDCDGSAKVALIERVRPAARAFIRPGLDEPEAVARYIGGASTA